MSVIMPAFSGIAFKIMKCWRRNKYMMSLSLNYTRGLLAVW